MPAAGDRRWPHLARAGCRCDQPSSYFLNFMYPLSLMIRVLFLALLYYSLAFVGYIISYPLVPSRCIYIYIY